jgi:hypothetical protein
MVESNQKNKHQTIDKICMALVACQKLLMSINCSPTKTRKKRGKKKPSLNSSFVKVDLHTPNKQQKKNAAILGCIYYMGNCQFICA